MNICAGRAGCFPCWSSSVLFICMWQSGCWRCWSLQVAGIRSLVIRLRANWVAALRIVCWRLSQNYPWIIPQNYTIPVRHCPLMGMGRGRVLDEDVCTRTCCLGDLDGAVLVLVSVSWSVYIRVCALQWFWQCWYIGVMEHVNPHQTAISWIFY